MSSAKSGPVPPYGIPIRDAIARGDLDEMQSLYERVKPAMDELAEAIARLQPHGGVMIPYGCPIRDAVARGDLQEMRATADAVRRALYSVEYAGITAENESDVREALAELEAAIASTEGVSISPKSKPGGPVLGRG